MGDKIEIENVGQPGKTYRVDARRLVHGTRAVPLTLAASGPKMLEMAGTEADAVLISAGTSVEFVRWSLEHVARGAHGGAARGMTDSLSVSSWRAAAPVPRAGC